MRRDLEVYLWDIKEAAGRILQYTAGKTLDDYKSDGLLRAAVERCFTILGEAMVRIRIHFFDEFQKLADAARVIDFRNRLVHLYDAIDDEQVWEIVTVSLPVLIAEVDAALGRIKP